MSKEAVESEMDNSLLHHVDDDREAANKDNNDAPDREVVEDALEEDLRESSYVKLDHSVVNVDMSDEFIAQDNQKSLVQDCCHVQPAGKTDFILETPNGDKSDHQLARSQVLVPSSDEVVKAFNKDHEQDLSQPQDSIHSSPLRIDDDFLPFKEDIEVNDEEDRNEKKKDEEVNREVRYVAAAQLSNFWVIAWNVCQVLLLIAINHCWGAGCPDFKSFFFNGTASEMQVDYFDQKQQQSNMSDLMLNRIEEVELEAAHLRNTMIQQVDLIDVLKFERDEANELAEQFQNDNKELQKQVTLLKKKTSESSLLDEIMLSMGYQRRHQQI